MLPLERSPIYGATQGRGRLFRTNCHYCSGNVLLEPVHEVLSYAGAVFFGHHLVTIARQSGIFEVHVGCFYACLIEPLGRAMGVRAVITRLSGHIEDRDTLQVYELVRGLRLNPARD